MDLSIGNDWEPLLRQEAAEPYFEELAAFVDAEYGAGECFPPKGEIFAAFRLCPLAETRVVLLGQDPYHGRGQAMGLSFSVPDGVRLPPSLRNIYKEVEADTGARAPLSAVAAGGHTPSGDLTRWARQGVLLLNATLTVRSGEAGSHAHHGWEQFTDHVISAVSRLTPHCVFLLWGNYARQKASLIDASRHLILESAHPSPLSAWHGFFGNHHFSRANAFLEAHWLDPIRW